MSEHIASNELQGLITKLSTNGDMLFLEGATEEQILCFEKENGIVLPQKYREWLQFSDGGHFFLPAGVQIYGVAHKPLINPCDDNKPNENYLIIGAFANGDPLLCEKDKETISVFNLEAGVVEEDETFPDFFSFLNELYDFLGIGE